MIFFRILLIALPVSFSSCLYAQLPPTELAVIGLTHTHVHWIFESEKKGDFKIVAIVEPDRELAGRYALQHGFSMGIVYNTFEEMLKNVRPAGVCAFGTIFQHLEVVQKAAPQGIHVMVEKPLAVNLEHARKMESLARKHGIRLLTNYETTWYPSNHQARQLLAENSIGEIRKVVVRDGHKGPKRIGINKEFFDWLTDPVQNGGGAVTDFGCYGINLMTWLMNGQRPLAVTAVIQQQQPENNPLVDDDATILLRYSGANAVIQPSWNWPIGRKDMEIYGQNGAIYADNRNTLRMRLSEGYDGYSEKTFRLEDRKAPHHDPFSLFTAVIRNEVTLEPFDLSSLENNMLVMEILDAAVKSAKKGRTINLERRQ